MATSSIQVNVIDVGQGQCTFVEIYDDSIKLVQTLLFDCGTNSGHRDDGIVDENLNYIARQISKMEVPALNGVFFSHGDTDHTNLSVALLGKINELLVPLGKTLTVTTVWYGGARKDYTKNSVNIINILEKDYAATIYGDKANDTSYDRTTGQFDPEKVMWKSFDDEVKVYAILTNGLSNDPDWDEEEEEGIPLGKDAEERNRVSLVCALYYKGASYVICGDATHNTMAAINSLFDGGTWVFNNNHMTTLPHHGSRATGFAVKSSEEASDAAIDVVKTFASNMGSKTITVSAYKRHSHPSLQLMNYFTPYTTSPVIVDFRLKAEKSHLLSAYIDNGLAKANGEKVPRTYTTFETRSNMFSTKYFYGDIMFSYQIGKSKTAGQSYGASSAINQFACWQYDVTSSGYVLRGFPSLAEGSLAFTMPTSTLLPEKKSMREVESEASEVKVKTVRTRQTSKKTYHPIANRNRFGNRVKQYH